MSPITIEAPDGLADDLRRLGTLDYDALRALCDDIDDALLDVDEAERALRRPTGPRATVRKRRALTALAETERTLLEAKERVLHERRRRLAEGGAPEGAAHDPGVDEDDDDGKRGLSRAPFYTDGEGGWIGR